MSHFRILLCLLSFFILKGSLIGSQFDYGYLWDYQPILINGEEVSKGTYNGTGLSAVMYERYERGIKPLLKELEGPIKVLDLGANNGFFSLMISRDFDALCLMVDTTDRLADICEANDQNGQLLYLKKKLSPSDLLKMAKKEHFDLILALHFLHNVEDWREWVEPLSQLGDHLILETPCFDDPRVGNPKNCNAIASHYLSLPNSLQLEGFPRGYEGAYDFFMWIKYPPFQGEKKVGISLSTFLELNGAFPRRSFIEPLRKLERRGEVILDSNHTYRLQ